MMYENNSRIHKLHCGHFAFRAVNYMCHIRIPYANYHRHSRRTPTPERLRFEHRRRGGSSQRDERNGGGAEQRGTAKRRSDESEHSKSLPPQSREKARRDRDGKTEAEIEAERKAKAEKDEADFQVRSYRSLHSRNPHFIDYTEETGGMGGWVCCQVDPASDMLEI